MRDVKDEYVVLLNDNIEPVGQALKSLVHHQETPLHLAFSCYIRNTKGQVLITRRALTKVAWPGVWTNSVCGHPLPEESLTSAVIRRAAFELGLNEIKDIEVMLESFQYCERDASGIVENEFCPVFQAVTEFEPNPNPEEVMDYQWVDAEDLYLSVKSTPWAFSPWMVKQLKALGHI
jgi:isopentenyl-diphosphate delta-isomerase